MEPDKQGDFYYARFSFQGNQRRLSLKTSNKSLARKILDQLEAGLNDGVFDSFEEGTDGRMIFDHMVSRPGLKAQEARKYLQSKENKKNFKEAIQEHLANCEVEHSPKTYKNEKRVLEAFSLKANVPFVHNVSTEIIEAWRLERVAKVDKSTINRELKMVKRFFKQSVEKNYIHKSPAENMKTFREAEKEIKHLSDEEIKKLLDHAPDDLKKVITFALLTGLRYGELCFLEWADIDFRRKQVIVQSKDGWAPKNLKKRIIPMQPTAEKILFELKESRGESKFVFPDESGNCAEGSLRNRIYRIFSKAKVTGNVKSLRSTFASNMVMEGYPIYTVSKLLGHHDVKITERHYAHLAPNYLQNVMTEYRPKWEKQLLTAGTN